MNPAKPLRAAEATGRYWCGADAFRTRFYETMSLIAPEAERFFIGSIRDYLGEIEDPALQARCKRFICEEAEHSRVHRQLNRRLRLQGIDAEHLVRPLRNAAAWCRRHLPRRLNLALTVAGEHIAAIMSDLFLRGDHASAISDPAIREVYVWHAQEELGHRSVAFEVLRQVARVGYATRVLAMLALTLAAPLAIARVLGGLLRADTPQTRRKAWRRGLPWLLGIGQAGPGPAHLLRNYMRYFGRCFDPARGP